MSVAFFIVPEREVPGLDTDVNGKALGRSRGLQRVAQAAGVRPLMEFFSLELAEAESILEDEGLDAPENGLPPVQWFPAAAGLTTVSGILAYLAVHPDSLREAEAVASDLREFESVLLQLDAAGVRWHLAVDS